MTTPPKHHESEESVEVKVPTKWLDHILSARILVPAGALALAGFGGFSARGVVQSCPPELTARLAGLERQIGDLDSRFQRLDERFDRLESRIDRLGRRIDNLSERREEKPVILGRK